MDVAGPRPYVGRVNLLLLLSALLSALTGAGVGSRVPQVAVTVSRAAESAVAATVKSARVVGLPVVQLPTLLSIAVQTARAWRLAPSAPIWLSRRRE